MGRKRTPTTQQGSAKKHSQLSQSLGSLTPGSNAPNELIPGEYPTDTGWVRIEPDPYARGGWLVSVNGVPSSHIAEDPLQLEFEYMRWFATAIAWFVGANPAGERLSITHLGGGACTMARYLCAQYPHSRNTVVELDEKLTILARKFFNLPRAPHLKIRVGEARQVTDSFTDASRDVLIRDVFAGDTTPASLSTAEFFTNVHRSLRPGGLYIANCGDHRDLTLARSELKTMATVFRNVACIADPQMLKGRRYGNIVLLGTDSELPGQEAMHTITRSLLQGAVPAQFKDHEWCERFMAAGVLRFDAEHAT